MQQCNIPKLYLILLLLFSAGTLQAQFYAAGQDPASVRWKQINTDNFQVIFPDDYAEQAKYVADILSYAYDYAGKSLEHNPRKISVIIHNQTVISNGFVSWAPRRTELYTNPPPNNDAHSWMERLVIHEFRHVVQIDKLNQGITRVLGFVFGEQAVGAMVGLYMPLWFLEGDAVAMETALTHSGRGRRPAFEQGLRAQVLTHGTYSFDKAVFGSYKNYVPNHYELGYQLVAHARVNAGRDAWAGVVDKVARKPWLIFPFSLGMKENIGNRKVPHYRHTFQSLEERWRQQKEQHSYTPAQTISPSNKLYTNYTQAYPLNDTVVIALKTGLQDIPQIVSIGTNGQEEKLFNPGWFFPEAFHYSAGKIVWNEERPDPRWEHRNWSEIMIYDMATGNRERLTDKGRFFSPALSPDAAHVAVIETTPTDRSFLVVINVSTGEEVFRFGNTADDFLMQPFWHPGGEKIGIIALNESGKRIDLVHLDNSTTQTLLPSSHVDIATPSFRGEDIIFTGAWSGINQIYRLNTAEGSVTKIVSVPYGAVNAVSLPGGILYSSYSASGYTLQIADDDNLKNLPLETVEDHSVAFHRMLAEQEATVVSRENIPQQEHAIEPYSRLRNLFHLHSWAPFYIDGASQEAGIGASLLFQNKLSTSFATLGYEWDNQSETGKYSFNYSYQGWYPVIDLRAETGQSRAFYLYNNEEARNFLYTEESLNLAFTVPLRFLHNEFFYGLSPRFSAGLTTARPGKDTPERIFVNEREYLTLASAVYYTQQYRLLAYRQRRTVARDIYPRLGQVVDIQYRHTPFGEFRMSDVLALRGTAFFPGLARHHGLRLSAAYQSRSIPNYKPNTIRYTSGNLISYPRGYSLQNHRRLSAVTADYALPFFYPDLSIPYLLYLKRVRGHIFADYARAENFPAQNSNAIARDEEFRSYGFGLTGDMHLFRFLAPISLGIEVAFPEGEDVSFQLLMGVRF